MDDCYTLWTLQPKKVLGILRDTGIFRADGRHADWHFQRDGSYQWMRDQFKLRRGGKGRTQIWAWHNPKPDLRKWSWYWEPGIHYRIECNVPKRLVLLSDYDIWHHVLNKLYVPLSRREEEKFEARMDACYRSLGAGISKDQFFEVKKLQAETEASWTRIFDLSAMAQLREDERYGGVQPSEPWTQAVFEELRWEWVTKITPFKGRMQ